MNNVIRADDLQFSSCQYPWPCLQPPVLLPCPRSCCLSPSQHQCRAVLARRGAGGAEQQKYCDFCQVPPRDRDQTVSLPRRPVSIAGRGTLCRGAHNVGPELQGQTRQHWSIHGHFTLEFTLWPWRHNPRPRSTKCWASSESAGWLIVKITSGLLRADHNGSPFTIYIFRPHSGRLWLQLQSLTVYHCRNGARLEYQCWAP